MIVNSVNQDDILMPELREKLKNVHVHVSAAPEKYEPHSSMPSPEQVEAATRTSRTALLNEFKNNLDKLETMNDAFLGVQAALQHAQSLLTDMREKLTEQFEHHVSTNFGKDSLDVVKLVTGCEDNDPLIALESVKITRGLDMWLAQVRDRKAGSLADVDAVDAELSKMDPPPKVVVPTLGVGRAEQLLKNFEGDPTPSTLEDINQNMEDIREKLRTVNVVDATDKTFFSNQAI